MNTIDLTPLYRNSIGFDRLASLLDSALSSNTVSSGYPPYNIEALDENRYVISLAVAGFEKSDIDITVDRDLLIIKGSKPEDENRKYLYQGIAHRTFERKFDLAEHIEVSGAEMENGLLKISLVKEIPEAMKPKEIPISDTSDAPPQSLNHQPETIDQAH
ncbi:molecular chaperone IbpA [Amphritea atlantica]|uniref:Molecular chaperone IbpA n=1 Tax=Amphritea atlantica TaxID=355243 RepID=A0A1H9KGD7_9GAMM|nr:Hsp20 family protein [Amphritea atlantica]SEQ98216.1 molecular chaperone IbpA [Amphritea atlantica]